MPVVMKIRDEMATNAKHAYIQVVGDFLLQHLERNPGAAEKVLAEGKTIKGSLSAMREVARKRQVDQCGVLTSDEGFAEVLKYYGIDSRPVASPPAIAAPEPHSVRKASSFDVSLDDLLKR